MVLIFVVAFVVVVSLTPIRALVGVSGTKRKTREGREKVKQSLTLPSRVAPKTPMSAPITPVVEAT